MDETVDHTNVSGGDPLAAGQSTGLPHDEECRLDSSEAVGEVSEQSSGDSTMSDRNTDSDSSSSELEDDSLYHFHLGHLCDWTKTLPGSAQQALPPKPEAIRQHDVFLSCHYNFHTLANQVYDNDVCPERTLKLDLKIVKKNIREGLLNFDDFLHAYGDGVDVPEPKFWIPANSVEKKGQSWKGKPGTRRTLIVGKSTKQMDVYEASDDWVIKENHGNSNRKKGQGTKRQRSEPIQEPYQTYDDLSTETETFEDDFCFIGVTLQDAVECSVAAAIEWASNDYIRRICVAGFQEDIRKIREWHLTKELYTGLHDEIQAEHYRQLERRLIEMVQNCYNDMVIRSRISSSAAAAGPPDDPDDSSHGWSDDSSPHGRSSGSSDASVGGGGGNASFLSQCPSRGVAGGTGTSSAGSVVFQQSSKDPKIEPISFGEHNCVVGGEILCKEKPTIFISDSCRHDAPQRTPKDPEATRRQFYGRSAAWESSVDALTERLNEQLVVSPQSRDSPVPIADNVSCGAVVRSTVGSTTFRDNESNEMESVRGNNVYSEDIGSQVARDEEDEPFHIVRDEDYAISLALRRSFSVHIDCESTSLRDTQVPYQLNDLRRQGLPSGLALEVWKSRTHFPVRFWSIDNGESMNACGSKQIKLSPEGRISIEDGTRWNELRDSVEDHIRLAGLMNAPSIFYLCDKEMGTSILSVPGPTSESVEADVQLARQKVTNAKTFGSTSVLERLHEFTKRIQLMEKTLREHEQDAVCVFTVGDISSDSSNQSSEIIKHAFVEGLLKFSRLPVHIVIRVCTDDEHVADFYHNLMLELPLVVMGDYLSDAKKVQEHNSWFNYALCLHRSREMGYHHRIFIAMTTRQLDKDELRELLVVLFGKEEMMLAPAIDSQWKEFYDFVSVVNKTEPKNWNAQTGTQESWIDMRKMDKAYSGRPRRASMFSSWRGGSQKQIFPKAHPKRLSSGDVGV